ASARTPTQRAFCRRSQDQLVELPMRSVQRASISRLTLDPTVHHDSGSYMISRTSCAPAELPKTAAANEHAATLTRRSFSLILLFILIPTVNARRPATFEYPPADTAP
ncbi:MAG: hypothetical protein AB7V02_10365, partial [Parvularculaceae bacterium]